VLPIQVLAAHAQLGQHIIPEHHPPHKLLQVLPVQVLAAHAQLGVHPQTFGVPPPPHVWGRVQVTGVQLGY